MAICEHLPAVGVTPGCFDPPARRIGAGGQGLAGLDGSYHVVGPPTGEVAESQPLTPTKQVWMPCCQRWCHGLSSVRQAVQSAVRSGCTYGRSPGWALCCRTTPQIARSSMNSRPRAVWTSQRGIERWSDTVFYGTTAWQSARCRRCACSQLPPLTPRAPRRSCSDVSWRLVRSKCATSS